MTANGYRISLSGNENVLKLILMIVAHFCEYMKSHLIVHFKWVNFMAHESYLNNAVIHGNDIALYSCSLITYVHLGIPRATPPPPHIYICDS